MQDCQPNGGKTLIGRLMAEPDVLSKLEGDQQRRVIRQMWYFWEITLNAQLGGAHPKHDSVLDHSLCGPSSCYLPWLRNARRPALGNSSRARDWGNLEQLRGTWRVRWVVEPVGYSPRSCIYVHNTRLLRHALATYFARHSLPAVLHRPEWRSADKLSFTWCEEIVRQEFDGSSRKRCRCQNAPRCGFSRARVFAAKPLLRIR